ncbi:MULTISPECIES: alpha/beta fold hydrolase [unclassified Variovorax]|uniref:alpha/beta fold hydrolase n=1 Tax=unclassified Variovorax TaxID=663243 RepID=UPI0008AED860|nr:MULTISPECIES: alpha/beta hydrolase [unclassified Variovorax]SEK17341.1 haloacetate dehalogenase [Variovorax sp. OK202]SFE80275.1 haloacetate dehalogenase [Variovorax sp. OK212]
MKSAARYAPSFFPGFRALDVETGGVRFAGVVGGEGPPLLLLHGYPQTHIAWRRIAPVLAQRHTVVLPDLPGYGASRTTDMASPWTKRRVGQAMVALMTRLGHPRFAVIGHDRGARAGYRLALDHPDRVPALVSLTVIPTSDAMAAVDFRYATRTFHWFLFAQEADLPERLLAADPDAFIEHALSGMTGGRAVVEPAAMEAYRAAFRDPTVRHAICEDYRAAMGEDLLLDEADLAAGRLMPCPVLVLWPEAEHLPGRPNPVDIWRRWATDVEGRSTSGGHLQPEDAPGEVLAALQPFLYSHGW